jgi:hypothetical protein
VSKNIIRRYLRPIVNGIVSVQLDLLLCDWVFPFITFRGYMTELLFNVLITCLIFVFSLALLEMLHHFFQDLCLLQL